MLRITCAILVSLLAAATARAQAPAARPSSGEANWRSVSTPRAVRTARVDGEGGDASLAPGETGASRTGSATTPAEKFLPNNQGQIWKEYPIGAYTARVTSTNRPEQAIVDWILRETGTDVWFSEPLGLLSANNHTLTVYHTPEVQEIVAGVVDRFVRSEAESQVLGLHLVTVGSPNWRSKSVRLLRSVDVQSPGVEAWLLSKENAAILLAELSRRTDSRKHNSPNLLIQNGQSHTLSQMRPRTYVRSVQFRETAWPSYELEMGQIDEGYSLLFSPLMSLDQQTIDAVIKCEIYQVERFVPVNIDVPSPYSTNQRVQIQVPQMVNWKLHERFRWPSDQVLLLSCGVVATPGPERATTLGIPNPFSSGPGRADALLFIESKGKASQSLLDTEHTADATLPNYRGRY